MDLPNDLTSLLAFLNESSWDYKLTTNNQGQIRVFTASVWKSDVLGGSNKQRHTNPVQALSAALIDARHKRASRAKRRKEHQAVEL